MRPPSTESPQPDAGLRCPKCGYNLTAVTSNTCPECGERFILTSPEGYLARFPPSRLRQACTAVWGVGTVLIILSWTGAVSPLVGWAGFVIAGVAWLASLGIKR